MDLKSKIREAPDRPTGDIVEQQSERRRVNGWDRNIENI